ncbi:hypothetical protein TNCV_4847021 [Trichonephila clavipes]|nr:hypothetical protein TNCV_4847021 [Trichonephila clavipes]
MSQYNHAEHMLAMCNFTEAAKHECDHPGVNKTWIQLKRQCPPITAFRSIVDHTIEGTLVCDVELRVVKAMVTELTDHVLKTLSNCLDRHFLPCM